MWMRTPPKETPHHTAILLLGGLSLVFYLLARFLPLGEPEVKEMHRAAVTMAEALKIVQQCRHAMGHRLDPNNDPNRTGLIGVEFSPLTTSRGDLQAKRTTANPNFAGLLVHLFKEAGVGRGDTVAAGASGSFPALILATLSAAKAMNLRVLTIYSVGASQWGANEPRFSWLDMESCLRRTGWLDVEPVAISLGGERDTGQDWSDALRASIEGRVRRRGAVLLREPDLSRNVDKRLEIYERAAQGRPIRAFVNIGGSWANMGESADILEWSPGLVVAEKLPPSEQRGVAFEMASRGVPVIHLLYIRGLVERYGLPWDPIPLPSPGAGDVYRLARQNDPLFLVLAATYLALAACLLMFGSHPCGYRR